MTALLSNLPNGRKLYLDGDGNPLVGGQVAFYIPGTTTLSTVYQDDQKTTASPNPVTLDADGTCAVYGAGEFRELVTDKDGNLVSDTVVTASTPLVVSAAMLPVLQAATPADAEALLTSGAGGSSDSFDHLNIPSGDQTLNVTPVGNAPATFSTLNVQGNAIAPNTREFLVDLGFTSALGNGGTAGNDKVTLYAGMVAKAGSADAWAFNPLITAEAGVAGKANIQCIEADINNLGDNVGTSGNLGTDFGSKVINGISISGAGAGSCTVGCIVNSASSATNPQWARGFTTAGRFVICGYQDWSTAPVGMQFDGSYSLAAINLTSAYNNAGAVCDTALFLKNNHKISWQSADTTHVASCFFDSANNFFLGLGSTAGLVGGIFMGGTTAPQQDALWQLGTSTNRWTDGWFSGDVHASNLRLANADVVSWANNPANNGGVAALVFDYVDASNNRIVGGASKIVYMGSITAPQTPGFDLGTSVNYWGNVYSLNGIVTPSDPILKDDIQPLGAMSDMLSQIKPISFAWKDDAARKTQYGFNANEVIAALGENHGGYHIDSTGKKFIEKDQLISVLWKVCQELDARVKKLEVTKV